jgi:hypothetical protein
LASEGLDGRIGSVGSGQQNPSTTVRGIVGE